MLNKYCIYGGEAMAVSSVKRRFRQFQSGDKDVSDKSHSCRQSSATNQENEARNDQLIKCNRRIKVIEMCVALSAGVEDNLMSFLHTAKCVPDRFHSCSLRGKKHH